MKLSSRDLKWVKSSGLGYCILEVAGKLLENGKKKIFGARQKLEWLLPNSRTDVATSFEVVTWVATREVATWVAAREVVKWRRDVAEVRLR